MVYPAFAAEYDQIVSTSDGTLDVGIYTIPTIPNTEEPTKLKIDFLKSGTERIQQHIDYRVSVTNDGDYVFGPMSRLLHTSPGSITIPVEFSENGSHIVHIEMEGILFQPIPLETATLTINVGQAETSIPDWIKNNAGWWADGQIDDGSFVSGLQFLIKEGVIKVHVEFWLAELSLQLDKSKVGEPITVTVVEPDMNLDFFNRDSLYADVYSTDTPWNVTAWHKPSNKEFELLITETSSGIFEGKFRSVPPSWWGDPWFTKSGDTIIVEYTDCTLPTPWSLVDCLTISDKVKLD